MNTDKSKSKMSTIALILLLTLSAIIIVLPSITAQEYVYEKVTYAFIGATPNPIGVNQQTLLHVGITDATMRVNDHWMGLTVTVTNPDGTTQTLGPIETDATGGTGRIFVPTQIGIYRLQTHFPAQTYLFRKTSRVPWDGLVLMKASDSPILELVVTQEPREYYPGNPLPTEYWTRPIHAELREWSPIAGSWLDQDVNWFVPYNENAPDSSHILWTKPFAQGGLVGGPLGSQSMDCGAAYEQKGQPPLIINGVLLYDAFEDRGRDDVEQVAVGVDIHTSEELWRRPLVNYEGKVVKIGRRGFGQLFYWDSYNMHSTFGYIWANDGDQWNAFDPSSGRWLYTMENVPSGSRVYGPKGEIYIYTVDLNDGWMTMWNSSRVVSNMGSWRPIGNIYNCTWDSSRQGGYEWNVTIPTDLPGSVSVTYYKDKVVGTLLPGTTLYGVEGEPIEMWAISLKPGEEGTLLWRETWQPPAGGVSYRFLEASQDDGIFTYYGKETQQIYGFSLDTGKNVWGPTESENYLKIYGVRSAVAYGNLYSGYMDGTMYCYNIKTGELKWKKDMVDEYTEILWSDNWPIAEFFLTDGKLYAIQGEHSPIDPKPRGAPLFCLDAETGEELWLMNAMYHYYRMQFTIGDSIVMLANTYDQRWYAIGKGPSATTVTAPDTSVPLGTGALIKGTVTDISPGTEEYALTARFPNGVPAIADEDMSDWMNYVYQQFERPADATGVPVKLEAVDPTGGYLYIGTATSDAYGNYGFTFTPETEGQYMIIATFEGSKSYYGSTTITYLAVADTVAAEETDLTPLENSVSDVEASVSDMTTYLLAILAVVIIALLIAVYSLLKSR